MKISCKCITFTLISLYILCMPKMNNAEVRNISIKFPFCIKDDDQLPAKSPCQSPEFSLYQNDKRGPFLELANAGNFTVDSILYSSREIKLIDPNDCLPLKLLSLDFDAITPFVPVLNSKKFSVYNCSGAGDHNDLYDEIVCLRGSSYTVVSIEHGRVNVTDSNCKFLKNVFVPTSKIGNDLDVLSSYSSIYLTWDDKICESCVHYCLNFTKFLVVHQYSPIQTTTTTTEVKAAASLVELQGQQRRELQEHENNNSSSNESDDAPSPTSNSSSNTASSLKMLAAVVGITIWLVILRVCWLWWPPQSWRNNNEAANIGTTVNTNYDNSPIEVQEGSGLNQSIINSYPTVVIGKSGRAIKAHDDKCSICLGDYEPGDTLKILPDCIHRFHSECIDLWLTSNVTCPVCRIPPHNHSSVV